MVLKLATLALAELDGIVNQTLVSRLVRRGQNQRGVGGGILRLVDIDSCKSLVSPLESDGRVVALWMALGGDSHSKSPESETTTVPVCLRASSEVDMVDGGG